MYQVSLDASFIQDMCEFCQCEHTPLMLSQQELCDLLEDAMLAREAPGMADVDSSLLWLCRKVAEKEQIILSGECSDEIFGGYPWFYRDELKDWIPFHGCAPQKRESLCFIRICRVFRMRTISQSVMRKAYRILNIWIPTVMRTAVRVFTPCCVCTGLCRRWLPVRYAWEMQRI